MIGISADQAVDQALDDPSAWTQMVPTEVWRMSSRGVELSSLGRVKSRFGDRVMRLSGAGNVYLKTPDHRRIHVSAGFIAREKP